MIQEGSRPALDPLAETILAAEDDLLSAGARELPGPPGRLLVDPAHPSIYDVNCIRDARAPFRLEELEAAFARVQKESGCRHMRVAAREPETIEWLDALLLQRGFTRQVCVAMAHFGPLPSPTVPRGLTLTLVDLDDRGLVDGVCACQDLVRRDEPWYSREVSRQMDDLALRQARRGGAEFLAATTRHGEVVGSLLLRRSDGVAFVADVGTVPSQRRRGIASALVAAATALARSMGSRIVGLTARRDDEPRHIYERLGFVTVGETVDWLRGPQ